ncbi:MAG: hypothetical protein CMG74_07705 [Candidatus Marinimicrobia bacterium]|nr:hypothetical protein [Candidatus Neomarinimicrobiota bacterium]
MSYPLISLIIPVYNSEEYLERCISSINKQKYKNIEIIFIDNNSIDESKKIIDTYCKIRNNVKLLFCKKQGQSAARNKGIEAAQGEYISFLDADDQIYPDKYQILLNALNEYPNAGMAIGKTKKVYENGSSHNLDLGSLEYGFNPSPRPGMLWLEQFQHHPHISSSLIKKKIISTDNYFPENLQYGEDISFSVKIGLTQNIVLVDNFVSIYNRNNKSIISRANIFMDTNERYIKFYQKFALPYFQKRKKNEPYKSAFINAEYNSFKILVKLIKYGRKMNYLNLLHKQHITYKTNLYHKIRYYIFYIFPFKYAHYIFTKIKHF